MSLRRLPFYCVLLLLKCVVIAMTRTINGNNPYLERFQTSSPTRMMVPYSPTLSEATLHSQSSDPEARHDRQQESEGEYVSEFVAYTSDKYRRMFSTRDTNVQRYLSRRETVLQKEDHASFGGDIIMSPEERHVNAILMRYKRQEYSEGQDGTNGRHFDADQHFFHARELIRESNVFKIIRMMPKGCALHIHDTTVGSVEWVAKTLTYWPNLYMCTAKDADNHILFRFSSTKPTNSCNINPNVPSEWTLVQDFRANASSNAYVDALFLENMSLYTQTPELKYRDNDEAWYYFTRTIRTVFGVVSYEEAMKAYYWQILSEFYEDNVMYIENRGHLYDVYRLDQTLIGAEQALLNLMEVTEKFKEIHPDFWGAKFILTTIRFDDLNDMGKVLDIAVDLKNKYPRFMPGFDIAYHEDLGRPNIDYLPMLLNASDHGLKYFFHAGESNWHGTKIDDNMLDAILLNSVRIGHGTALNGRPYLVDLIQERGIGVEVNPISSQILRIVEDFRNHPAVPWFKRGFPIVISSDDAGMGGSSALSFDWYIAFMAMGGQRADLRFLKQLALNSIELSAMSRREKRIARGKWEAAYDLFISNVLLLCYNGCP